MPVTNFAYVTATVDSGRVTWELLLEPVDPTVDHVFDEETGEVVNVGLAQSGGPDSESVPGVFTTGAVTGNTNYDATADTNYRIRVYADGVIQVDRRFHLDFDANPGDIGATLDISVLDPPTNLVITPYLGHNLGDHDDVNVVGLVDGETILWNDTLGQWEPGSPSGAPDASETVKGIMRLATQADVDAGIVTDEAVTPATAAGRYLPNPTLPGWAASNVTSDRVYDANVTSMDELSDIVGTLIADLISAGILSA